MQYKKLKIRHIIDKGEMRVRTGRKIKNIFPENISRNMFYSLKW
jgi:hypothetical protein